MEVISIANIVSVKVYLFRQLEEIKFHIAKGKSRYIEKDITRKYGPYPFHFVEYASKRSDTFQLSLINYG